MKSKYLLITGACFAAIALCGVPSTRAKGKTSPTPEPSASASPIEAGAVAKTERAIPYRGKIASIDSDGKTFAIKNKSGSSRVFKMTERTKIMKDGAPATTADVTADQDVRGSYWKKSDGTLEAKSVMLGAKAESEKSSSKKKQATDSGVGKPSATP
jgi:hypothetical protein